VAGCGERRLRSLRLEPWGACQLLGAWIATHVGPDFPWGAFVINISGSFLIGIVLGLATDGLLSTEMRLLLAVGVLEGYTTFSTFSYETLELLADGNMRAFLLNALGQTGAGLDLSQDLPVVIIAIDRDDKIEGVIPKVEAMVHAGLITVERVGVAVSRPLPLSDAWYVA